MAEIDAMRSEVEQHGLAAFLTAAAANQWQAPAIPSAWSVANVVTPEQLPVAEAARTFGGALLDAIDANCLGREHGKRHAAPGSREWASPWESRSASRCESASRGWHGGLGRADSYVPLILSYPGGNRGVLEELVQATCEYPAPGAVPLGEAARRDCHQNKVVAELVKGVYRMEYEP